MTGRRPPTIGNQSDLLGGVIHLLAEILALVGLLGIVTLIAWLMLVI